jgi:hypothetical protein
VTPASAASEHPKKAGGRATRFESTMKTDRERQAAWLAARFRETIARSQS